MRRWPLRLIVGAHAAISLSAADHADGVQLQHQPPQRRVAGVSRLDWYVKAFNNDSLIQAFINSLTIAFFCTIISVALGALAAVMLWRFRFPGKTVVEGGMALPIVVPEICLGVAMLVFFARVMPWPMGSAVAAQSWRDHIAHVVVRVSVRGDGRARAALFVQSRAGGGGKGSWRQRVAHVLGCAGAAYAAGPDRRCAAWRSHLSLDDFVITFFTAGPDTITFPVKVYSMLRFSVTPEVNAASTILIVVTVILTAVGLQMQNQRDAEGQESLIRMTDAPSPMHRRPSPTPHVKENAIISFQGVTKRFGKMVAVDNVNLDIAKASSSRCSGPPAAARRRCCACSRALRRRAKAKS